MSLDMLSQNDKIEITAFLDAATKMLQEVADIKGSLKDLAKDLADKYDVKPAVLNKAARAAFKANINEERDGLSVIEEILQAGGRL